LKERERQLTEELEAQKEREMNGAREMIRLQLIAKEAERVAQEKQSSDAKCDTLAQELEDAAEKTFTLEGRVADLEILAKDLEDCLAMEKIRVEEVTAAERAAAGLVSQLEETLAGLETSAEELKARVAQEVAQVEEARAAEQAALDHVKELEEKLVQMSGWGAELEKRLSDEVQRVDEVTASEQAAKSSVVNLEGRLAELGESNKKMEERLSYESKRVEEAAGDLVKQSLDHRAELQRVRTDAENEAKALRDAIAKETELRTAVEAEASDVKASLLVAEGEIQATKARMDKATEQIRGLISAQQKLKSELEQAQNQTADLQLEVTTVSATNKELMRSRSNVFLSFKVFASSLGGPMFAVLRKAISVPVRVVAFPFKAAAAMMNLFRDGGRAASTA